MKFLSKFTNKIGFLHYVDWIATQLNFEFTRLESKYLIDYLRKGFETTCGGGEVAGCIVGDGAGGGGRVEDDAVHCAFVS